MANGVIRPGIRSIQRDFYLLQFRNGKKLLHRFLVKASPIGDKSQLFHHGLLVQILQQQKKFGF